MFKFVKRYKRRRNNFWNKMRRSGGCNYSIYAEGLRQKFYSKHGRLPKNY